MKRLLTLVAFVAGLVLLWFLWPGHQPTLGNAPAKSNAASSAGSTSVPRPAASTPPRPPPQLAPRADPLNSPATDIRADLRLLSNLLDTFRTNFPHDGNPVGDNAEITAALTGQNRLRFAFIPPDHPAIDAAGELCDRWGTPFFFHALSSTRMEIRSAGPDKKLYTPDDIVLTP